MTVHFDFIRQPERDKMEFRKVFAIQTLMV